VSPVATRRCFGSNTNLGATRRRACSCLQRRILSSAEDAGDQHCTGSDDSDIGSEVSELSSSISVLRRELQRAQEQRHAMKNLNTQKQKSTPSSGISTPRKRSEQSTPQDGSPGSASNPKKTGKMETSPGVCVQRFYVFFSSFYTSECAHKQDVPQRTHNFHSRSQEFPQ